MKQKTYNVRVFLTEECPDSIEEILHGDGSSLGPTQDKVQKVAKKFRGCFEDWEPSCCDYSFPSKEAAMRFAESVRDKFKTHVQVELIEIAKEENHLDMRIFQKLPKNLSQRVAALTPKIIEDLNVEIVFIDNSDCLNLPEKEEHADLYRTTHINMKCKITNKIRGLFFPLRSSSYMSATANKNFHLFEEGSEELERAKKAGWTLNDVAYESLIQSVLRPAVSKTMIQGKVCPEILFACTKLAVVINDYSGKQFVGWYFYNENLDEPLNFTNFKI